MLRNLKPVKVIGMLVVFMCLLTVSQSAQAADDNLNIVFTTTNAGGSYGSKHVHVVWITDTSGNWVETVGTNVGNKRSLWANQRASSLKRWYGPNPSRSADVDARTGATQNLYRTYNINWNWRRRGDGSEVPDGTYRVHLECTNADSGNPSNYAYFNITKGASPQSLGPVSQGGYKDISLTFTPGAPAVTAPVVSNIPASNITYDSARLNGQLEDDGGNGPFFYFYWGDNDGVTNPGSWDHYINLGKKTPGVYYTDLSGLSSDTTYYFRCFAVNSGGIGWAGSTASFTTATLNLAEINLNPASLNFPDTAVNAYEDMNFDIENTGSGVLTVNALSITGLGSEAYSVISSPTEPFDIPTSSSQTVTIRFSPSSGQSYDHAKLAVASNAINNGAAILELTGQGSIGSEILIEPGASMGGICKALAVEESNVFLAQGAILTVLDASVPDNLSRLGSVYVGDIIEGVSVYGDTAYAAAGNLGFAAVGLNNPYSPKLRDIYETQGYAYDIASDGAMLCVADGPGGLAVYDISSAYDTVYQGSYTTEGSAVGVDISGTTAYILDDQLGLQIVNASTRSLIGALNEIEFGRAIAVEDTKAYITDQLGNLFIVNITTPSAPVMSGQIMLQGVPGQGIAVNGNYAYISSEAGVEIVDISNSSAPVSVGVYQGGSASDIVIESDTAYVALRNNGLSLLNIENAISPVELDNYALQTAPTSAQADSSIVYVSDESKGLQVIDLSSMRKAESLSTLNFSGQAQSVFVSSTQAFIANGLAGLQIVDISNPQLPVLLGQCPTTGFAKDVAVSGNTAIVAVGDGVDIIDITNSLSPALIEKWESSGWACAVAIDGGYGYVANGGYGLEIINLSSGTSVGCLDTGGNAYGVDVSNNIAYIADGANGLQIIDVTSPSAPVLLGSFDTAGMAMDVKVIGQRVCIADSYGGISVINVSNPAQPSLYAMLDLPLRAVSITVAGSKIVVTDQQAGMVVLNTLNWPSELLGDIHTDLKIDLLDLKFLADDWLNQETMLNPMISDLNNDDTVNYLDFSMMASYWLLSGN